MNRKFVSFASLIVLGASAGPWTVWAGSNQWTSIGPEGGGVLSLAVDPQDSRTVYAGTGGGIFKSQDRGVSWINSGLMGYVVATLGIDPQDSNTVYAVTHGHPNQDTLTINVFKSTNGGRTWNEADSGLTGICCGSALVIDPINRGTVYVVSGISGVWKSTDGGTFGGWLVPGCRTRS